MVGSNDNFIPHSIVGNDSFLRGYSIYYKHDLWKVETFRLRKIWKTTSLTGTKPMRKLPFQAHSLVNKQTTKFPPPPPPRLNVVFWVKNSFLASSTSHINIVSGGGGEEEVPVVELRREK